MILAGKTLECAKRVPREGDLVCFAVNTYIMNTQTSQLAPDGRACVPNSVITPA